MTPPKQPGAGPGGLTLGELARELPEGSVLTVVGDADVRVVGVHQDSRRVEAGDLFVARRGATSDGTAFVGAAVERGATAILVEGAPLPDVPVPQIVVADARRALAFAAAAVYGHPAFSLDIVGITGTNGKTTTSYLVQAAVDAAEGRAACGIIGTVGHAFGDYFVAAAHTTPEPDEVARVLDTMRMRGATHVVMEVSSIALSLGRVDAIRFRVAAFTNLTQDHLDFHGTMDAYAEAKAELFTKHGPGVCVINVDDPFGRGLVPRCAAPVLRATAQIGADASAAEIAPLEVAFERTALRARFRTPHGEAQIASRLVGRHNLENVALALGIACALDLDVQKAAAGLSAYAGVPGRLERCEGPDDDVSVLVDYAHTPDALVRALEAARGITDASNRLICVFGCGGDRDRKKRGPMGEAAARGADVVVVTSDNPRTEDPAAIAAPAVDAARAAGARELVLELDRARAIRMAVEMARPGDTIVVAGKGHEDYQIIGREKRPFDDRAVAREALRDRRARTRGNG